MRPTGDWWRLRPSSGTRPSVPARASSARRRCTWPRSCRSSVAGTSSSPYRGSTPRAGARPADAGVPVSLPGQHFEGVVILRCEPAGCSRFLDIGPRHHIQLATIAPVGIHPPKAQRALGLARRDDALRHWSQEPLPRRTAAVLLEMQADPAACGLTRQSLGATKGRRGV